jgi:bacterioferritin
MDEPNIKTLNELLQGEHMAIESYESVLPTIEAQQTKEEINRILSDHKQHAEEITDRIISLGGIPKESTGMVGVMSQTKLKAEGIFRSDKSMLKKLYDGEDQGLAMVEKIIEGDLDATSLQMVQNIVDTDHDHLKKLQHMINSQN